MLTRSPVSGQGFFLISINGVPCGHMNEGLPQDSYSAKMRRESPEKMEAIEHMIQVAYSKARVETEPSELSHNAVAMVANSVSNRAMRKRMEGASAEDIEKEIENAIYEGIDERLALMRSGKEKYL